MMLTTFYFATRSAMDLVEVAKAVQQLPGVPAGFTLFPAVGSWYDALEPSYVLQVVGPMTYFEVALMKRDLAERFGQQEVLATQVAAQEIV